MIDLRPIHDLFPQLPLETEPTNENILKVIDALSVACFHCALPMRMAQAESWVKAHPEPKKLGGLNLLVQLGLAKAPEMIERRR